MASDGTALRHEDYLAVSAENQRLKQELEKMKKPQRRFSETTKLWFWRYALLTFLTVVFVGLIFVRILYPPTGRRTVCYFARQLGVEETKPWQLQRWGLFKSNCEGCMNVQQDPPTGYDNGEFSSRENVMIFIKNFNMEACK
jgi:hypothetical protein